MRVSREQAEKNRENVLRTAARLFRQHGIDGVSVADLMKAAGLTHGGFYGQFASKEDLARQATAQALKENADVRQHLSSDKGNAWEAFKKSYLSSLHRQHPESGCAFTTLAVEAPRREGSIKSILTDGLQSFLSDLEAIMPRRNDEPPEAQAIIALSAMVGALVLARAVDDEVLADKILETVRTGI